WSTCVLTSLSLETQNHLPGIEIEESACWVLSFRIQDRESRLRSHRRRVERPLCSNTVRTQLRLRANSSRLSGNPAALLRSRLAAIPILARAIARATTATLSRA